ncbi:uncharacterized protein LOC119889399 isoform X1 [Micropterus salmoides]|uniref:uncharacterized protein LOC119889399 isoform X1 n=1 Tax=Micropterus salmoides TaxID=27706 RepID=UPI0018EBD157|nr:uncharacterized protein LOC119889399 isoform X1 [Micropterus salmoides]
MGYSSRRPHRVPLLSAQTRDVPDQIPLTVVKRGDNVTLTCPVIDDKAGLFYWYKLKFGYMVQTVAAGTFKKLKLEGQFDKSRFTITRGNAQYFLHITNVTKEDEATYFCQEGASDKMKNFNGVLLAVNDHKIQQKSVYMRQSPDTQAVHLGDSVTLNCSLLFKNNTSRVQFPEEHFVYWFRAGSEESYSSVIYTQSRADKDLNGRCDYSLSTTIQNSSDAGTYYCPVIACGEILFGEGTKVETRQELCPFIIVLGTLLAGCVIVIVVLIILRNHKPVCEYCKGGVTASKHVEHDRSDENQPSDMDDEELTLNYVALNFPSRQTQRWTSKTELPQDCIYSGIRVNQ